MADRTWVLIHHPVVVTSGSRDKERHAVGETMHCNQALQQNQTGATWDACTLRSSKLTALKTLRCKHPTLLLFNPTLLLLRTESCNMQ